MNNNQQDAVREGFLHAHRQTIKDLDGEKKNLIVLTENRETNLVAQYLGAIALATITPATQNPLSNENGGEREVKEWKCQCGGEWQDQGYRLCCYRCGLGVHNPKYKPTNPTADAHKSISLLACANVLINSLEYAHTQEWRDAELMRCWPYYSDAAKAVLEAAGVNYVE